MLNRRTLIRGAAGLIVAAGAGELLLPERRVWALGTWEKPEVDLWDEIPGVTGEWVWLGNEWHAVGPINQETLGTFPHRVTFGPVSDDPGEFYAWLNEHPTFVHAETNIKY